MHEISIISAPVWSDCGGAVKTGDCTEDRAGLQEVCLVCLPSSASVLVPVRNASTQKLDHFLSPDLINFRAWGQQGGEPSAPGPTSNGKICKLPTMDEQFYKF